MTPKIEAVQRMQDYIAAHQTEEINLSDLANTACYSPWYCYRIFKELTEMETRNVFIQVIKKACKKSNNQTWGKSN